MEQAKKTNEVENPFKAMAEMAKANAKAETPKTKEQRAQAERIKTFDEISTLYRKAETLNTEIKAFANALQKLNEIVLKKKSEKIRMSDNGTMESEADQEGYKVIIYKAGGNYRDEAIVSFSNLALIKECASVVARAAEKAKTDRTEELDGILEELKK